jgi:hypothetical protein
MLIRYWFGFNGVEPFNSLNRGCGVTAYNLDDAKSLLSQSIFKDRDWYSIKEVIENVDITTLDQGHVIPNMEPPVWRGVWFPKGYRLI